MRRLFLLTIILLIGFSARTHLLGNQELRGDEGFSWNYIQGPPADILARIIREGDPQPPLHYWLLWGWAQATGESEFAMRSLSALLSLIVVAFMFKHGQGIAGNAVGYFAAAITALHPQQVWLAQDVRNMYQMALIALLAGAWLLLRVQRLGRASASAWVAYIVCGLVAMYSHYYALFALIAQGALLLSGQRSQRHLLYWAISGIMIGAGVLPWALVILPVFSGGQLADPGSFPFGGYALAVFGDLLAGASLAGALRAAAVIGLGALLVAGAVMAKGRRAYLLAAIIIPFFGIYAVTALRATFNTFYFVFAFPAAVCLIAIAAQPLLTRHRRYGWWAIAALAFVLTISLGNHYYDPQYSKTRGMRDVAAHIASRYRPGDVYLANFPDPVQGYYLRALNMQYHMQPGAPEFDRQQVKAELLSLSQNRLWHVPIHSEQWDSGGYVFNQLAQTALLAEDNRFGKMRLTLFLPLSSAQPLSASFDDGITLIGYHRSPTGVTLVWQASAAPTADYTVFVHVLAHDTFNLTSHDAPPARPTTSWQAGDVVLSVHPLSLPTDQPINLVVGLYDPSTGHRLPIQSAAFGEPNAALVFSLTP